MDKEKKIRLKSSDLNMKDGKVIIESEELKNILIDSGMNLEGEDNFLEEESNLIEIDIHIKI